MTVTIPSDVLVAGVMYAYAVGVCVMALIIISNEEEDPSKYANVEFWAFSLMLVAVSFTWPVTGVAYYIYARMQGWPHDGR